MNDLLLNIDTSGIDESKEDFHHNRYEATPYEVLDCLIESGYILKENNQEHIINWMEKVDEKTKNTIVEQVLNIDFEELKYLYNNVGVFEQKKTRLEVESFKNIIG
mgnify:CR=1 FL=1